MSFNYKDLTYIRAALQSYSAELEASLNDNVESDDDMSDIENDILYLGRLIALTNYNISEIEGSAPSLNVVKITPSDE